MNRKKIISLALAGLLSMSLFGCGKNDDSESNDIKKDEQVKTENNKEDKVKKDKVKKDDKHRNKDEEENKNEEENKEENQAIDINKDEVKDSIVKGKDIVFNILTSRDENKVDYENNRTGLIEEYNSIEKIKSALNPYYTDRYIEDFLNNILRAEEENGELTINLGDIGMWAEYSEMDITDIKDLGNNIYEVNYTAPSGVGDINHKATMEKVENNWKMDKEVNY